MLMNAFERFPLPPHEFFSAVVITPKTCSSVTESAPDMLQGKFVTHAKEDELREIKHESELYQEKHSSAYSDDSSSDNAKESKALI